MAAPTSPLYPLVQLVAAPERDTEVRFDFNQPGMTWPDHDAFSLGAPALRGEPGGISVEYDYRAIPFKANVTAGEVEAGLKLSELGRVLVQHDENYLLFQYSPTTAPVWFRCLRSPLGEMSLASVYRDRATNKWGINVSLVADPFALGEKITHTLTIGNNPATGGLVAVLPDIKGDAAAPLVVDIPSLANPYLPFIGVAAYDIAAPGLQFWQAESWTLGAGASVAADSTFSGGSKVSVTLAEDPVTVLTGSITTTTAGRFRLFTRAKHVSSGFGDVTITGAGGALVRSKSTRLTGGPTDLVELGEYSFPAGNPPTSRPYTLESGGGEVEIKASGGGDTGLALDYIVAVPVDGFDLRGIARNLEFRALDIGSQLGVRRIDGEHSVYQAFSATGGLRPRTAITPRGGFPVVTPGASNLLHFFLRKRTGGATPTDEITDSATLICSYRPRYAYLPGI